MCIRDSFKAKATTTTDYKFTVTAARGNIVDSTGKRIATTSTGYNVVLNLSLIHILNELRREALDALLKKREVLRPWPTTEELSLIHI